jgi:hypothetical protein
MRELHFVHSQMMYRSKELMGCPVRNIAAVKDKYKAMVE